ncbi:hypothetical protein E4T39_04895 [Aureobasidium subglaciale]|nr:hypothetical protein E4T39_04895 [Aureobasidium subglaciale]
MSTSTLDRIVKGAPPPDVSLDQVAQSARRGSSTTTTLSHSSSSSRSRRDSITAPHPPASSQSDPLNNLPSSPEQIKLNLLILESSLRAQYLCLSARLRLYLVLMSALALWISTFTYLLFLRPREDGKGSGGSPYWVVDMAERLGWVGGLVTAGLVWGTGMWDRGVRWPRKWVNITNRGLRGFNLKLVVIRGPWWKEALGYRYLLDPWGWWGHVKGMRFEFMPKDIEKSALDNKDKVGLWETGGRHGWIEEDVAPGGDVIKLLLLPKPFSPDFREDWDTYRHNYWEKENERRAQLRAIIKTRRRQLAKQEGGWLWWTGWRGWTRLRHPTRPNHDQQIRIQREALREKQSLSNMRDKKARPSSIFRETSHSRSSSRSSTPESLGRRSEEKLRRMSNSSLNLQKERPKPATARRSSRLASSSDSRPGTPNSVGTASEHETSPTSLHNRASNLSISSNSTWTSDVLKEDTPPTDVDTPDKDQTTPKL